MTKVDEQRVHEIFNTISSDYDKMNSIISFRQHDVWRAKVMKKMRLTSSMTALDLCCGTGDWTLDLAEKVAQVTGLDFSENMLAIAEQKVSASGLKNIELLQGNAMELPFEDGTFDVVTIGYGLRNTPDYLTVLKEMRRVLKPGGQAVCIDTSHPTLPVYKQLFKLYFKHIMPMFGRVFAKSPKEYQWLQQSAQDFPDAKTLKGLFEQAGFNKVDYQLYGGAAVAGHFAEK